MNVLALCDRSCVVATRKATGVEPLVADGRYARDPLVPDWHNADFVYIDLHPGEDPDWLYNLDGVPVLSVHDVAEVDNSAVLFFTTCRLNETSFLNALSGNHTVIYGEGINYGGTSQLVGAPALARHMIRLMEQGQGAEAAYGVARLLLFAGIGLRANRDTIKFKIALPGGTREQQ